MNTAAPQAKNAKPQTDKAAAAAASMIKKSKNQVREFSKMRYFRFRCRDVNKTMDFYKSCGMNVDFEGYQECIKPPTMQTAQAVKNPAVNFDNIFKKGALEKESTVDLQKSKLHVAANGRVFGMSFGGSSYGTSYHNRVMLLFEEDLKYSQELQYTKIEQQNVAEGKMPDASKTKPVETGHQYEYLVIYVHFLQRLVKRMASKNYEVEMDVTNFDGVKLAIMRDPNNIQIRFVEMPDSYLNDSSKKQWFARLGYYSLATSNADATALLYESLFHQRVVNKSKDKKDKDQILLPDPPEVNIRKVGANQTVKNALAKGSGFRIVDMDDLVIGLMNTVFYWLGNDMRTHACCVCITEVSNADTGQAITRHNPDASPLIGIGFEVPSIEAMINRFKQEKQEFEWDPVRLKIGKAGMCARFSEKINDGIYLELFCQKIETSVLPTKGTGGRSMSVIQKPIEVAPKEEFDFIINLNHIGGHSRNLSEGAIICLKGYGQNLLKDAVEKPAPPPEELLMKGGRKFDRKIINIPIAENESTPNGSQELLQFGRKPRVKPKPQKVKERDDLQREAFISREKSKSI
ncbi:hypothetical protein HDV06_000063 [Boothiomyces sp. JEL0866]|nr:hypothetical protein HDV06_000063 [Boothiomyces sp. JEL0866]